MQKKKNPHNDGLCLSFPLLQLETFQHAYEEPIHGEKYKAYHVMSRLIV